MKLLLHITRPRGRHDRKSIQLAPLADLALRDWADLPTYHPLRRD